MLGGEQTTFVLNATNLRKSLTSESQQTLPHAASIKPDRKSQKPFPY